MTAPPSLWFRPAMGHSHTLSSRDSQPGFPSLGQIHTSRLAATDQTVGKQGSEEAGGTSKEQTLVHLPQIQCFYHATKCQTPRKQRDHDPLSC